MKINDTIVKFQGKTAIAFEDGFDTYLDLKTNLIEIRQKVKLLLEDNTILTGIYAEDID